MPTMMTRPHTVETHFKAGGHFDSASLPAPAKSRIQKQLAQLPEIVDHILRHHGPDEGRSAHPDRIRIHVLVLEEALQIAKRHGLHEGLSPIHFEQVEGIWENDKYVKEVRNKVVHHLFSTHFKESLGSLISGLTSELYHEPFTEVLDGLPHLIRPSSACSAGGDSSSKLVREYLVSVGRSELAQALRSFHFCQSPKGEAMRQDEFDELVKKKGDFLFSVSFHGSMQRMIEGLSAHAIRAPLTDRVCGVDVIARCSVLLRELKTSEGFLQRYFDLRPELRVAGICRHHIGRPGRGVVSRQETNDSIVINRGNAILYGKYDGRLDHFLREISAIDLFGGEVEESIDGLCLKTKLAAVKERFSSNVFDTVVCYLGLTDRLKELPGLRSYHLPRISTNSFDDPEIAEEILAKKIAQMIEGSGKSAAEIVSTLTSEAIRTPLIDRIGEFEFVVSTHAAFKEVSGSPFKAYEVYRRHTGSGPSIPRGCFIGSTTTRVNRAEGKLSKHDISIVLRRTSEPRSSDLGFRQFSSHGNRALRHMMVDTAYELLGDADISYLGLETERFESLRLIGEQLNLSPEQSYVIESDPRVYEAMLSIQNRRTAAMRAVLNGLNIRHGRIEEEAKKLSGPFNLVYLDFFGHTSPAKQSRLVNLIEENKLGASALVVVKVSNSPLSKFRAKHLYGTEDQSKIISDWTNLPSPSCHSVQRKFLVSYKGGTEANNGEEMLAVGFEIKREM